ncbi:uncharacterized protein DUF938 [Rhodothalassium salexigens DSM 2132]|uniref:Uncharacterized protein DUF938 n=1 Tax=Rhodothalassium salexigens DSM 2132 TaxID=1188247 RepID=A0A4R2P8Y4_RHOSA|nr:DUF938 domain-containing protein [Rhodothalassium salexigens]MBB4212478.1 SAM-dependent methyltransferase [Rhodothalassium salexigens DSM 2132]MBK1639532.1 SAM-dependent methyltransferase [Rhodothalassium salexigens DSM 2132]TCP31480.1 uncharacterized protein DUF938 [Rhodothalassium salexigens DSM 2132]
MDDRRIAPAAERNKQPILDVLGPRLPRAGLVLEVAAGTGQHAAFLSRHLPGLDWQPTDPEPDNLASIQAHAGDGSDRLRPARALDVTARPWAVPLDGLAAVVAINLIHIAPWDAARALVAEAGARLSPGGLLYLYGPFKRGGVHSAPSNAAFDDSLAARDPRWGVRDLDDVAALAAAAGFASPELVAMPANNLSVLLRREDRSVGSPV